jgi:arylsulfatase A-like enzyme
VRKIVVVLASVALAVGLLFFGSYTANTAHMSKARAQTVSAKPNIVFILTDDQPPSTLSKMPILHERLAGHGMTFRSTVSSNPLCCPSRATLQTGQYTHNHGVRTNTYPNGGWPRFRELGLHRSTVATWLNGAGYRTGYFGKYMNEYDTTYVPPGWDKWFVRVGDFREGKVNANGTIRAINGHQDSVYKNQAVDWVKFAAPLEKPFFLSVGFYAPHGPGIYNPKYADRFRGVRVPRDLSFNEANVSDKPGYVRNQPLLSSAEIADLDALYRNQLRSLMTVDEAVGQIADALWREGELSNTYFVFYTDNGTHLGQHRFGYGKQTPYRTDTRFPLIVRGPGVAQNTTTTKLASSNDIAPTLARMGRAGVPSFVDGRSLLPVADGTPPASWRTALLSHHWRHDNPLESGVKPEWWALMTGWQTYVEYETGEKEFYRLGTDPYETQNVYDNLSSEQKVILHNRLETLKGCAGSTCDTAENGG